jgi:ACS family D-galactonate transporter-like MFS transporter
MAASAWERPLGRRRWTIAWLLGIGVLVNYFDRVNLSVSHDALYVSFGVSNVVFGYLSGAYNWTYAMLQLPMGRLLDRFGVRQIGRASIGVWSVASFLAALSPGVASFFGARLLLGVGEAPTFPANAKAIGAWFPAAERSVATSIFDAAAKFASAIGVPVLGLLLLRIGWRWSFAVTGALSLVYLLAFSAIYREPEQDTHLTTAEWEYIRQDSTEIQIEQPSDPLAYLLKQRKVLALALGMGSYNYVFYLLLTWLPSYLSSALHIDLLHSFLYTGVPWLVATVTDLLGGWSVDRLIRRGWDASAVRKTALVCGLIFGLGLLGAGGAHTPLRALGWISLSIGGLAAAAPIGWSLPSLIAPRNDVGSVGGIVNFANQLSGIAAPILTGYCVAATHNYQWAFRIAAIYLLIGIASYLFLFGKIEPFAPAAVQRAG